MAATMRSSPFTIYTDSTQTMPERRSTSPSPYDADGSILSDDSDVVVQPIENSMELRVPSAAYSAISSIPPSLPRTSDISPYTPRKTPRPPFRSPNSVRALQMASPPPFSSPRSGSSLRHNSRTDESPNRSKRYRMGTPDSFKVDKKEEDLRMHLQQLFSGQSTPATEHHSSPAPKTQGSLVLLHVTLLPCPVLTYSAKSISELAEASFLDNWRLLQEKLGDTVLSRGILIPHPGEEYDLLEERLLESLDLCTPRILDCGHFYGANNDSEEDSGTDSGVSDVGRKSSAPPYDHLEKKYSLHVEDNDVCQQCSHTIRLPGQGIGSDTRRWNVKIYAANGMMRAGAWAAAWREMERVDVEIEPWLSKDVKRQLDARREQEEQAEQKVADEADRMRLELEKMDTAKMEADAAKTKALEKVLELELEVKKLSAAIVSASKTTPPVQHNLVPPTIPMVKTANRPSHLNKEVPISQLLWNYLYLLAQDRRNIALGVLSILVLFLAIGSGKSTLTTTSPNAVTTSLAQISQSSTHVPSISVSMVRSSSSGQVVANAATTPPDLQSVYSPPAEQSSSHLSDGSSTPSLPVSSRRDAQSSLPSAKFPPTQDNHEETSTQDTK